MTISLATPSVAELPAVFTALREWQHEGAQLQLHPGDLGWHVRLGEGATAAALRTWSEDGRIVALGLLDGPDVLRYTTAPSHQHEIELARQVARDIGDAERGILPAGEAYFEAPNGTLIRDVLGDGWTRGEAWAPLRRDLADPVEDAGVRVEEVSLATAAARVAIQRAAFPASTFTVERWQRLTASFAFADARDLIAFDTAGNAVAAITVWSAGPGRPGLIEPLGVPEEFRGRGFGRAITLAGAAALRELGSSSALVCTEGDRAAAIATYRSAGFVPQPERYDLKRS